MNNTYSPFGEEFWLKCKAFAFPYTGYVLSYIEDVQPGKNNAVITRKNRLKLLDFSQFYGIIHAKPTRVWTVRIWGHKKNRMKRRKK